MKTIILLLLLLTIVGCDAFDSMTEGFTHTQEVASELEQQVGSKPFVGFNWHNGVLTNVSITFYGVPEKKSANELIELSRISIAKHFKQTPKQIVLAFAVEGQTGE